MSSPTRTLAQASAAALLATSLSSRAAHADDTTTVAYRTQTVQGVDVFYREAGPKDAPVVLLLHGFPTSSFMFRELIPLLATEHHVIAPDYPGFGQSGFPPRDEFAYTFDHLSHVVEDFVDALALKQIAVYVQDYGAPIGLRLATRRPELVKALIVQNGNAYEEGLSDAGWSAIRTYWREPTQAHRDAIRPILSADGIKSQYIGDVPAALAERVSPDTWTLDYARISRPDNVEVQLDLFADYQHNVEQYPAFHAYFRQHKPKTLITWGIHDPFFTVEGARAYLRDLPDAQLELLDAGHFALETSAPTIARHILGFLRSCR
ncbi:MAG: alpha/beta hydrolase [Polyangiales bacterium]